MVLWLLACTSGELRPDFGELRSCASPCEVVLEHPFLPEGERLARFEFQGPALITEVQRGVGAVAVAKADPMEASRLARSFLEQGPDPAQVGEGWVLVMGLDGAVHEYGEREVTGLVLTP